MNTENAMFALQIASYVVAGVVVILHGLAPLTKTDKDDKLLDALRWVEDKLSWILPAKK